MVAAGVNLCRAQSNDSQTITHWGNSVQGVQLSIRITNNIFQVGSSTTVMSVTKNSSTNTIAMDISAPTINFDIVLTNNTGTLYHVTTRIGIRMPGIILKIKPGEEYAQSIPVTFEQEIEPGDYTLKATRQFGMSHGGFELESNSIEVQVIK